MICDIIYWEYIRGMYVIGMSIGVLCMGFLCGFSIIKIFFCINVFIKMKGDEVCIIRYFYSN